ncbi:hypothetical protein [Variovorax paradoxus]|uniref:DUF262 domain-containing protein n=1 Tax=Variovorax paradoxus TaxID=34073 RepID=A0A679JE89_VARPD|nr:hypothetical protein VVAX_04075 [Variovorax paradoxus]
MQIKSILEDRKVAAQSVLIEISIRDYLKLAKQIYKNNEFQRKRVRNSKSVYSLLKRDILHGCVIPPIVLAYTRDKGTLERDLEQAINNDGTHFVLLDGLQRSYTLMDIEAETTEGSNVQNEFLDRMIRCEIYEGINRIGILYRMLTLNTGQTSMSVRHQIEIMYQDFLHTSPDGITLVREVDEGRARQPNSYNFREIIEGFNSYLDRNESQLDRGDVLENIASLENLAKENDGRDIFRIFLSAWHAFILKIGTLGLEYPESDEDSSDELEDSIRQLWGATGVQIFKKAQAVSGFGAAIGLLRDDDPEVALDNLELELIVIGAEPDEFMVNFNQIIEAINSKAKRIGNAQRLFFRQFFRMLFWKQSGCYLNLSKALEEGYKGALRIGI